MSLTSLQVTAQLLQAVTWEKVWLQHGRASLNSSLSDLAPLCEAGLTVAWQVLGEANLLQDLSEGEMCSHRNATFGAHRAKLDRSVWTLNPLRVFLPPPGHCSRRICQVS